MKNYELPGGRCNMLMRLSMMLVAAQAQEPFGFQTGPDDGATYGGSVLYRSDTNRIYLTGASYGTMFENGGKTRKGNMNHHQPACYLGIAEVDSKTTEWKWLHTHQWDTAVPEACNTIFIDKNPENLPENNTGVEEKVYLMGYTGPGGSMDHLRLDSVFAAKQYGMILDVDLVTSEDPNKQFSTTWWGGRLLQDGPVQYPTAMAMDEEGYMFVASVQTYDTSPSKDLKMTQAVKQVVDPQVIPFGMGYNMLVEQFMYDNPAYDDGIGLAANPDAVELDQTIVDNWRQPYSPSFASGGVLVSGMEYLGGVLVIVGSTTGHGPVFGDDVETNQNYTDTSMDGFITKIQPGTGSFRDYIKEATTHAQDPNGPKEHKRSAIRIESVDYKEDFINGMCSSPADPNFFYIIGTSGGQMDKYVNEFVNNEIHSYLMKIDVWTLQPIWVKQFGGEPLRNEVVRGVTCAVTDDGKSVYMAGNVENGSALSLYGETSHGGNDIFIAQIHTDTGRLDFMRQIGTSGNEQISSSGLTTDKDGNAIVMGHTDGSFFRSRQFDQAGELSDDLFVMTVVRHTGEFKKPQVDSSQPTKTDAAPEAEEVHKTVTIDDLTPHTQPTDAELEMELNGPEESSNHVRNGLVAVAIIVVCIAGAVGMYALQHQDDRDIATDRGEVLSYLNDFDVDDIDLKHSATGGWHCSYANDLAHGINARDVTSSGGLFGGMSFGAKNSTHDPLLASRDEEGEITFEDEIPAGDAGSTIGSGIASGRHSTHESLIDQPNGRKKTKGRRGRRKPADDLI